MKSLFIIAILLQGVAATLKADDSRFRFHRMEGVTGIPTEVSDEKGTITTVVLSKDSDPAAMAILNALIGQQGVWGSLAPEKDPRGVTWDQGIVLMGAFASVIKRTPDQPNAAAPEPYREFKISGINIEFPFARWVETDKADPVDTPYVVEFHLELRSLIPNGIIVDGKSLDLKKYESKSKSEQGVAPNRSLPPSLKSTSPVRGSED